MTALRTMQTLLLIAVLAPSGCLMSVSATSTERGTAVPESATAGIVIGQTTRDELVRTLGRPDRTTGLPDGGERLIYETTRKETAHVGMLLLMRVHSSKEHTHTTSFDIRNGVVVDMAREHSTMKE